MSHLLQICLFLFPGDSLWPQLFYALFAQSQIVSLYSLTFCLVINEEFSLLKLIFISWPYFYFVIEFHLWLKYKIYSRRIENYSFSLFSKIFMNKELIYSIGHIQKSIFNRAEQQMNGI